MCPTEIKILKEIVLAGLKCICDPGASDEQRKGCAYCTIDRLDVAVQRAAMVID